MKGPILTFRVYPQLGSLYFLVTVFATRKEMHAYCKTGKCRSAMYPGRHFEAIVHSFSITDYRRKRARKRGLLGEIHFYRQALTMNIITHESGHAALGWFRRKFQKRDLEDMKDEEEFCYALGHIGREIAGRTEKLQ